MLRTSQNLRLTLSLIALPMACSKGGAFDSGKNEQKPGKPGIVQQANAAGQGNAPIARATYAVVVKANSTGMEFCKGKIAMTLSTGSFTPEGVLKCLAVGKTMDLDLGALMKNYGQGEMVDAARYPEAGMVFRKPNAPPGSGGPQFDPPRIFSISLLVQNPAQFKDYAYRENASVQFQGQQDQGQYFVEVHAPKISFQPPMYRGNLKFDNVIHYTVKTTGFKKFPRSELDGALEHFEMYYNTRPISIPKIVMKSPVNDLLPGAIGQFGQVLFSGVTIDIDLIEHIPIQ